MSPRLPRCLVPRVLVPVPAVQMLVVVALQPALAVVPVLAVMLVIVLVVQLEILPRKHSTQAWVMVRRWVVLAPTPQPLVARQHCLQPHPLRPTARLRGTPATVLAVPTTTGLIMALRKVQHKAVASASVARPAIPARGSPSSALVMTPCKVVPLRVEEKAAFLRAYFHRSTAAVTATPNANPAASSPALPPIRAGAVAVAFAATDAARTAWLGARVGGENDGVLRCRSSTSIHDLT